MTLHEHVARTIRRAHARSGRSCLDVAIDAGVSERTLRRLVRGEGTCTLGTADALAAVLGVDLCAPGAGECETGPVPRAAPSRCTEQPVRRAV